MNILIVGGGLQALSVARSLKKKKGIVSLPCCIEEIFRQNQNI